jgi:hypothetical protein
MSKYRILKEYKQNLTYLQDVLGSGTTNNIELNNVGSYLFGDAFKGVYASDEEFVLKKNEMCIINTDDKKGIHWIACYKYNNKTYVYDSFDRDVKTLSKYWKNKHNWINANKDRDQSYDESNCGQRSMAFLISFNKYKTKVINII